MREMPKANILNAIFTKELALWHRVEASIKGLDQALAVLNKEKTFPEALAGELVAMNCYLWHEEDKARSPTIADMEIAKVKRNIDKTNQARNDKIEELDRYFLRYLEEKSINPGKKAALNSETPGSIMDRLSILALKMWHMKEETERKDAGAEHRAKCKARLKVMKEQKGDLSSCLDVLILDISKGRKRLKMYYQFRMYNEASTNRWMR